MLITKVKGEKDAYIPEYKDITKKVTEALRKNKAKAIARAKTEEYLKLVQDAFAKTELKDFAQTVKSLGLEVQQAPVFGHGMNICRSWESQKNFRTPLSR